MTKLLKFDRDNDVHRTGFDCPTCLVADYPHSHGQNSCPGVLHAEYRFDLEAGIVDVFRLERCDFCQHEVMERVEDQQLREAALALRDHAGWVVDETRKASADDEEPHFTLKARDAFAVPVIMMWQNLAVSMGVRQSKLIESNRLVRDMIHWQRRHKVKIPD